MNTAADYEAKAAKHLDDAQESFERCDTDGYLSQWAHGVMFEVNKKKAEITKNGGKATFAGLYDGDRRVVAKLITTKFGVSWLLDDAEAERYGRKFVPVGGNSKVQKALGLSERDEWAPAWVTTAGANMCSVTALVFRTGDKWGSDSTLVG